MTFYDGTCSWTDMMSHFSIERQALKIQIPTTSTGQIGCADFKGNRIFPRLDYSHGFPNWWFLDHTSISVPSQHYQEGHQYDAEVILAHFYETQSTKNQLGQVSIFLDAYATAPSWPFLDKLICQWRRVEEQVRQTCGHAPVTPYGRCALFRNQQPTAAWLAEAGQTNRLRRTQSEKNASMPAHQSSVQESMSNSFIGSQQSNSNHTGGTRGEFEDEDAYVNRIYQEYKQRSLQNVIYQEDYANVPYFPYEWLFKVETEYYFRYEGTMVVPPCHEIVHWRVMKDPIRVNPRQIKELNRLLAWRLSSSGSNRCKTESAGVITRGGGTINVARDLQYIHPEHQLVFCECKDFTSIYPNDRAWCQNWQQDTSYNRFYKTPYSFDSGGHF